MTDYDIDGALLGVVEFIGSSFPVTGTAVDNIGTGGAAYDGTANDNGLAMAPSGVRTWKFDTDDNYITVPQGAAIDNFTVATWEFGFYLDALPPSSYRLVLGKQGLYMGHLIRINADGSVTLYRYTTNESNYRSYKTPPATLSAGHHYSLHIKWDCTGYAAVPVGFLGTDGGDLALLTWTNNSSGTTTSWQNDATYPMILDNWSDANSSVKMTLFWFRYFSALNSDEDITANYNASKWRFASTPPSSGSSAWGLSDVVELL